MYATYFKLHEPPFSIAPDPAYLFLSARHQEALGHLLYGTGRYGGFVQLTGEVGTGKTTIVRTLLRQKLEGVEVAMVHNPRQSEAEFVATICDEFHVHYPPAPAPSLKTLVDALNGYLLETHAAGRRSVLIIDEAQNLSPQVLEQVRLLTNLETDKEKLLRIMLVGQPELAELLARPELRQLASRITARYHLPPLTETETREYIGHRLRVAGGSPALFTPAAMRRIHRRSRGIPRQINIICDRALLGAYAQGLQQVTPAVAGRAADEALGASVPIPRWIRLRTALPHIPLAWIEAALACVALIVAGILLQRAFGTHDTNSADVQNPPVQTARAPRTPDLAADPDAGDRAAATASSVVVPAVAGTTASLAADADHAGALPETTGSGASSTPNPPVRRADFGRILAYPEPVGTLMGRLIALWDPQVRVAPGDNVCTALARQDLQCYRGKGQWIDLERMNRPAILSLSLGRGTRYVLLRQTTGNDAVLDTSRGPERLPVKQLDAVWDGNFLVLWRSDFPARLIGPGSSGDPVLWIRRQLAQAAGQPPPDHPSPVFDAALRQQIMDYQRSAGLTVDGIAGAITLISLSGVGRSDETPSLRTTEGGAS